MVIIENSIDKETKLIKGKEIATTHIILHI